MSSVASQNFPEHIKERDALFVEEVDVAWVKAVKRESLSRGRGDGGGGEFGLGEAGRSRALLGGQTQLGVADALIGSDP